jgi:hypothetical protein
MVVTPSVSPSRGTAIKADIPGTKASMSDAFIGPMV